MGTVYEFRPLPSTVESARELRRYAGGAWIADDGEHDLAFICTDRGFPMCYYITPPYYPALAWRWARDGNWGAHVPAHPNGNAWHHELTSKATGRSSRAWGAPDPNYHRHPNRVAGDSGMSVLSSAHGCANGRGAEFDVCDPYIRAGLVRRVDTKEIVVAPNEIVCMYCGPLCVEDGRFSSVRS